MSKSAEGAPSLRMPVPRSATPDEEARLPPCEQPASCEQFSACEQPPPCEQLPPLSGALFDPVSSLMLSATLRAEHSHPRPFPFFFLELDGFTNVSSSCASSSSASSSLPFLLPPPFFLGLGAMVGAWAL